MSLVATEVPTIPVNLICKHPFRIIASHRYATFVVCVKRLLFNPYHAVTINTQVEFGTKLYWCLNLTPNDRTDVWPIDAHNLIRNRVYIIIVYLLLLSVDLPNHSKPAFLIGK